MRRHALEILLLAISAMLVLFVPVSDGYCSDIPVPLRPEAVRPGAESGPTRISVGIWLADISRIDSASQTFSANMFFTFSWRDPSLAHGQPGVKQYNIKDIWHPNWLIINAASKLEPSLPEIAEVAGDGSVYYRQRFLGSFTQSLDLRTFPFDHATFRIHFVMISQYPAEIQFVPNEKWVAAGMPNAAGVAQELTLQDWRITGVAAHASPYQIAPGAERAGYVFEFRADRLKQHYIVKVIIPLLLIVMMSWLVFWIDQSLGNAKISVAVTSMLTLIAYRFAIGNEVPKLPYLTSLDAFILVSTILVFLALIEVIVTNVLLHQKRENLALAIDHYCRPLFPISFVLLIIAILFR
jgi:hypothetical protein